MLRRRVVITGMGMITPVGNSVDESWSAILAGHSGAAMIDHFDASAYSTRFAAPIKNFNVEQYMSAKDARKMDVFIQYAMAASAQAIEDAGLEINEDNAERIGVFIGSGIGGLSLIEENHDIMLKSGPRRISPFFVPGSIINMTAGNVSIKYGIKGPNMAIATACASGTHSIGYAARTIAYGDADAILAGGAEKASTALGMGGFAASRALSTRNDDPQHASRPWDKDRDGFMLGDGAGILMLEEYEHAKKRGAKIYAELVGFGLSGDAYHMTSPPEDGAGAALSIKNTLKDAQVNVDQVQYINAHGTSTPAGDLAESRAVESVFGASAQKLAMSSTKSMTGHLLGAAGAIEAIFSILAIRDQIAPPTINLDNPGEGCHLNYVPHKPQEIKIEYALSNSFGFGGTNGSLLFKKM